MARSDQQLPQHLQRFSDLDGYGIEEGDLDPRGWTVVGTDGRTLGTVDELIVDVDTMKVRYFEVDLDDSVTDVSGGDDHILVDATSAVVDEDRRQVVGAVTRYGSMGASGQSATESSAYASTQQSGQESASYTGSQSYADQSSTYDTARTGETDTARLTRSEEELRIGKRQVARGEARVAKRVETEHVREPVAVRREEVVIERRPVTEGTSAAASIQEGEIRVPLVEEEVVVEKRPVVKEELVIGKRVVEETEVVETDLRKERFEVENETATAADRSTRRTPSRGTDQ